ncbi:6-bladed beta-propeller, partial [Candidatus Aminicenantes bacterium AC-334-E05]|nr:6-bladed beta-propeller [Candidatus Aminicenantes bacterium AC-334-E05]
MWKKNIFLGFILVAIISVYYGCKKHEVPIIINSAPKYQEKYVDLEKLFSIDVTEINLFTKRNDYYGCYAFDSKNNLYILDTYEGIITVYDENGNFVRSFGGKGQGPNEFYNATFMLIKKDKIYVYQGLYEIKVLTLEGELIKRYQVSLYIENPLRPKVVGDKFYLLKGRTDRTFTKLELVLSSELNEKFSGGKDIWRYKYPHGLPGYPCWEWLMVLDTGEFFFPEDNHNKYLITKYDKLGRPILKFGRKYKKEKYSKEAIERFYSIYKKSIENGKIKVFDEPPIVRAMFQDLRKNIWVVFGETYEDNMHPDFENSVDIFSEKGEWLYSFKTKKISKNIFYNNGKIYKVSPLNVENYEQFIDVYEIKYL